MTFWLLMPTKGWMTMGRKHKLDGPKNLATALPGPVRRRYVVRRGEQRMTIITSAERTIQRFARAGFSVEVFDLDGEQ